MAERHTSRERLQLFSMGFRRGAGMKAIPQDLRDDEDFQAGYAAGRKAHAVAFEEARERYGAPPPSILRLADVEEPTLSVS